MSSSGSSKPRKNAAGSRSDVGWQHGIDVDQDSKSVKCNYCKEIIKGGIYRFKHHLAGTHKDSKPCISVPDDVRAQMLNILMKIEETSKRKRTEICEVTNEFRGGGFARASTKNKGKCAMEDFIGREMGGTQTTINQLMKKDLREQACQQIARFFYTSAIPFNCVRNPEFVKMFELVGRYGIGFKPPSYHEIREKYLKIEVNQTLQMLEEYKVEWKKVGCSIMSDGWTDKKRRSVCNFLVNSPKGMIFLTSIDTSDISKIAQKVFEMLDNIVEKVGEENVVQVVTDNAANYKAAGEMLMEKRKRLYWTPCAAHCIDLILEDFEKKLSIHKMTIATGRKITTYIYSRTMLISMLREFTKQRDLIRPAATRFATAYLTLGCLNDLKGALMTMFSSKTWLTSKYAKTVDGKCIEKTLLDGNFWQNVITCLKAAYPLIKVLRLVDSNEKPAIGFIYAEMDRAVEKIKANFGNIKKRYENILDIVNNRWELQLHRPLHSAAYYLNPHFHYSPDFKVDADIKIGLYSCMERLVPDSVERCKIDVQLERFKNARGLFGFQNAKDFRTLKNPAEWWDSYGDECPELQRFAIRVLSLTCSSSGCERNWSAFEMVHAKRRNCLHQKKMNDLVFVMFNLKLRDKQTMSIDGPSNFEEIDSDDEWITGDLDHGDSSNEDILGTLGYLSQKNSNDGDEYGNDEDANDLDDDFGRFVTENNEIDAVGSDNLELGNTKIGEDEGEEDERNKEDWNPMEYG